MVDVEGKSSTLDSHVKLYQLCALSERMHRRAIIGIDMAILREQPQGPQHANLRLPFSSLSTSQVAPETSSAKQQYRIV